MLSNVVTFVWFGSFK